MSGSMERCTRLAFALTISAACMGCVVGIPVSTSYLTGAAKLAEESQLSEPEKQLREQSRNFDRTVWQGVLIGTALSMVGGGGASSVAKRAAIGAAAGALVGAYIAYKQKQYAEKEDQLDSMIADVRESNQQAEALIASARVVLDEDKRKLVAIERQYRQGAITDEELRRGKMRVGANVLVIAEAAKGAKQKYEVFQGAKQQFKDQNPSSNTKRIESELETYNEHIQTLDQLAEEIRVA